MISSEFVAQQRESQKKALKTLLLRTLGGSIAFHLVLLLANVKPLLQPDLAEQEEIVIVTDSVDEPEVEQIEPEPESEADLLTGGGGGYAGGSPAPAIAVYQRPDSIQPSPTVASVDVTSEPTPSQATPQPAPTIAPVPSPAVDSATTATRPSNFQNLLEQLRRNREAESSTGVGNSNGSPTVVAPGANGTGTGTGNGFGNGSGTGAGTGRGTGMSTGTGRGIGNGSGTGNGTGENTGSSRGSRSIACRDCPEVEYPEEALEAEAEGQVRVSVETDEEGRVVAVTLVGSSGNSALDRAVLQTVRDRYRFDNVGASGATIPVTVDMTLEGSERNEEARRRGERTQVEVPDATPAAEAPSRTPEAAASSPEQPQSIPETLAPSATSVDRTPESSEPTPTAPATPIEATPPADEPEGIGIPEGDRESETLPAELAPAPEEPPSEVAPEEPPSEVAPAPEALPAEAAPALEELPAETAPIP